MSLTQPNTQSMSSLERDIAAGIDRAVAAETPPPGRPEAGGRAPMWGPSTPRSTSPSRIEGPLQLLAQVADHAHAMNVQMLQLVTALTGEQAPAPRLRQAPLKSTGLLPNIAAIAHEIEEAHLLTSRLIEHARSRL